MMHIYDHKILCDHQEANDFVLHGSDDPLKDGQAMSDDFRTSDDVIKSITDMTEETSKPYSLALMSDKLLLVQAQKNFSTKLLHVLKEESLHASHMMPMLLFLGLIRVDRRLLFY